MHCLKNFFLLIALKCEIYLSEIDNYFAGTVLSSCAEGVCAFPTWQIANSCNVFSQKSQANIPPFVGVLSLPTQAPDTFACCHLTALTYLCQCVHWP